MRAPGKETKIFDPKHGFGAFVDPAVVTDSSVTKRGNRWWMYVAGRVKDREAIQIFSASLPEGAPLAANGWALTPDRDDPTKVAMLAGQEASRAWDLKGGRHCPAYVRGWYPGRGVWVERIYYAGGADHVWGPYTIGYLEWNGSQWVDQSAQVFSANADGKWKMWYVAGSNQEDYIVHGFSESPAEEKVFDFCVIRGQHGYEAVFSRVWLSQGPPSARTGLWWCHAKTPSSDMADWSTPVQIMNAEDRGSHAGPWKPSVQYGEADPNRMFVFFDGLYAKNEAGPFPYAFTLGCLEIERP